MPENEYRVRAVKRYVITHYRSEAVPGTTQFKATCGQIGGDFPNIESADEVAKAMVATHPGSTFATIEDRREPVAVFYAYDSATADRLMEALHPTVRPAEAVPPVA